MWAPKIYFESTTSSGQQTTLTNEVALIQSNGLVLARRSFYYVGFCDIEAKYYPYDAHTCFLQGISYDVHVDLKGVSN